MTRSQTAQWTGSFPAPSKEGERGSSTYIRRAKVNHLNLKIKFQSSIYNGFIEAPYHLLPTNTVLSHVSAVDHLTLEYVSLVIEQNQNRY